MEWGAEKLKEFTGSKNRSTNRLQSGRRCLGWCMCFVIVRWDSSAPCGAYTELDQFCNSPTGHEDVPK